MGVGSPAHHRPLHLQALHEYIHSMSQASNNIGETLGLRSEDHREDCLEKKPPGPGLNVPSKVSSEAQHSHGSWETNGS